MKNIKHLIAFVIAILLFGTAQAATPEAHRSSRGKDHWQTMQTVLYNHFVDTTGLCVISPIDADLLVEITPDLAKAFHVKEKVDLSQAETLGDVICDFMMVKYAGRSGPTYDYYKYRYSKRLVYDSYVERYPNSPYVAEMRMKSECLKQYYAWMICFDENDYFSVLMNYESSKCPFGGFAQLVSSNNESRELAIYYVKSALSLRDYLYDFDEDNNQSDNYINLNDLFDDTDNDIYEGDINSNSFWLETPNDEPKKNNIIGKTIEL